MNFRSIANALGITEYPEALDGVYETLVPGANAVTEEFITHLEDTYGIIGEYTEELRQAARDLLRDGVRLAFVNTVCAYLAETDCAGARALPMPTTDGSLLGNMLPLLIHLSQVPAAYEEYVSRGFSEAEAKDLLASLCKAVTTVEQRYRLHGINAGFYSWLCRYTKCRIFRAGIFNAETWTMPAEAVCLKNRITGEIAVLMCEGRFHRSGRFLGSAGCTDAEGAFEADFSETEDAFVGHRAKCGTVSPEMTSLPKTEWYAAVRPGDDVLNLHIPQGAALTPENIRSGLADAIAISQNRYPECDIRGILCISWLLAPELGAILGGTSKIVAFGNTFLRYPAESDGFEVFRFVFPGAEPTDPAALPEDTGLQRRLKAIYLSGGCLQHAAGIIPI